MSDDEAFDHRLVKPAQAYAKLYPTIVPRLKAAYDAGHPLVRQVASALGLAMGRAETNREQRLQEEHGLSPQETRVALHLIDGGTVTSAAECFGSAESTIRTHIKGVFSKTGIRRQAALPSLLSGAARGRDKP
jgi:DNA-binding CsgD family transcriptional regulator